MRLEVGRTPDLERAALPDDQRAFVVDQGFPISFAKCWGLSKPESLRADTVSHLISLTMA
jgi:hypothetical protein